MAGSRPVTMYAAAMPEPHGLDDILQVNLKYANGSLGAVAYLANGDKSLPKERLEVFMNGASAVMDDFKILTIQTKG